MKSLIVHYVTILKKRFTRNTFRPWLCVLEAQVDVLVLLQDLLEGLLVVVEPVGLCRSYIVIIAVLILLLL